MSFVEYTSKAPAPETVPQAIGAPKFDTTSIGDAVTKLSDAGQAFLKAQDHTRVAQATTDYLTTLDGLVTQAKSNPDFQGAPQQFDSARAELETSSLEGIRDPLLRAQAEQHFRRAGLIALKTVKTDALSRESDFNVAAYEVRKQNYQTGVLNAGSPVERESVIQQWNADIEGLTGAGWFSAQQSVARRQEAATLAGNAMLAQTNEALDGLKNHLAGASDAPAVLATTADIQSRGEAILRSANLPPLTTDAMVRAWRGQAAAAGLARLAAVDPAAARLAGGVAGPGGDLAGRIATVESNGNPNASNPNSSALGLGQFTEGTWLSLMSAYRPELVTGKTREQVLALRTDATLSKEMIGRNAEQTAAVLKARGLPMNDANIYLGHFLGADGAANVLAVDPKTPVDRLLSPQAIAANRSVLEGKTAGDVIAWAQHKIGSGTAVAVGPGDALFAGVPLKDRIDILNSGETHAARATASLNQQAERTRKSQEAEFVKEAYSRSDKGTLTPAYVEAIRPHISAAEYKNLLSAMGPDAAADDPTAIVDLTARIDSDNPAEFQKVAATYLQGGKLKTTTFVSLSEKNRAARHDDAPASPYRSGRDLVKSALEPGMLVTGTARAPFAQAQANALTEYDNWAQAHPQATRAEALSSAQDVTHRYQTIDMGKIKISLGTSRYFGNKGRDAVTIEDIGAAEGALFKDDQSGAVSPETLLTESRRLNNWRAVLEREQKAKEAARARTPAK